MFGPEQYLFIVPVWGEGYVERFVKLALPSQLSPGNLGSIPEGKGRYIVYTRREHRRAIERSAAWKRLRGVMDASIESLDDLPDPRLSRSPHELQTAAYTRGVRAGAGRDASFIFLTPDTLFGDGTLRALVRRAEDGNRCLLAMTIRMTVEGASSCIARHGGVVPCRELVRAGLDNLHPISEGHLAKNGRMRAAQHIYHRAGSGGLLARGYHLHPLFVWPRNADAAIRNTLDDEYIERACPDPADWFIPTDSDEMCVFEFSESVHKADLVAEEPLGEKQLHLFLNKNTTAAHRRHVLTRIRIHTGGTAEAEWAAAEAESDAVVNGMLELHERGVPAEVVVAPPAPASGPLARIAKRLTMPLRALYRLANFKLYRYADRLNAQAAVQQFQLNQAVRQLNHASKLVTDLVNRVGALEEEARRAAVEAAREADRRRRLAARIRRSMNDSRFVPGRVDRRGGDRAD